MISSDITASDISGNKNTTQAGLSLAELIFETFSEREDNETPPPSAAALAEGSGRLCRINENFQFLTGAEPGDSFFTLFPELLHLKEMEKPGTEPNVESHITRLSFARDFTGKDGRIRNLIVKVSLVYDGNSRLCYAIFKALHSGNHKIEEELIKNSEKLNHLFEQAAAGIFISDLSGVILDINHKLSHMLQYDREEMLGMNIAAFLPADELKRNPISFDLLGRGEVSIKERMAKRKDGTLIYIEVSAKMFFPGRFTGIVRDITRRKTAEKELKESEEQYRKLIELTPNTVLIQSSGQVVFINNAGVRLFGASSREELIGRKISQMVHPSYLPAVYDRISELNKGQEKTVSREQKILRIDGSAVDVEVLAVPFTYKGNQAVQVIIMDISKRKAAEEELNRYKDHLEQLVNLRTENLGVLNRKLTEQIRDNELAREEIQNHLHFLRTLIETLPSPIYIKTAEKRYLDFNQALIDLYGFTREQAIGSTVFDVTPRDYAEKINASDDRVLKELGEDKEDVEITDPRGRKRTVQIHKKVLLRQDGTASGIVGVISDITEQSELKRKTEMALMKEKELNDLKSRFLSLASHEFKTPLASIRLYSDLLYNYDYSIDRNRSRAYLEKIQKTVDYMNEIVDDVLTISRVETGRLEFNPVQFNLESYCLEVIQEVKASYPDSDISLSFLSQRSEFTLDRKIIRLILINLLSNAVKYSNKPARVKLEVTSSERDLFLTVSDCGIGITEKDQKNLFEYFHRGENTGSIPGTGLGLAIVKKSVEMHGGSISFKSRLNNGTAFFITIPFGH